MIKKKGRVVAIDGPAGTGKSSAAKRLAEDLGFTHVDTGALYRSVAYVAVKDGLIEPARLKEYAGDEALATKLTDLANAGQFEFRRDESRNPSNRVVANGEDVTDRIRTPEMSLAASWVSAIPGVRSALLDLQRRLGCENNSILEGRDIGTVIFPDADLKFFLVASVDERAKRRLTELEASGADLPTFEEVKSQMMLRDQADMNRETAPLKKPDDAIVVDTSDMTLDEVVESLRKTAEEKFKG